MSIFWIFLTAVGLSMDSFAMAIALGLRNARFEWRRACKIGLFFGAFQGVMPIIGFFLGFQFYAYIASFAYWIAFLLLASIGGNMIREAFSSDVKTSCDSNDESFLALSSLSLATSIDAFAVGFSFACLRADIFISSLIIFFITFVLSFLGVKIGCICGEKYKSKAELAGGVILILTGLKILLGHYNFFLS